MVGTQLQKAFPTGIQSPRNIQIKSCEGFSARDSDLDVCIKCAKYREQDRNPKVKFSRGVVGKVVSSQLSKVFWASRGALPFLHQTW
jgi:hypothetical protein